MKVERRVSTYKGISWLLWSSSHHTISAPTTPPLVALLAQLMSGMAETAPEIQLSKTVLWAAAFMAGTEAGSIGDYNGSAIDKAQL